MSAPGEKHQLHSVGPFAIGIIPSGFRGRFIAWGDHILSVGGKRTRLLVNLRGLASRRRTKGSS